jgi:hypothetical protein
LLDCIKESEAAADLKKGKRDLKVQHKHFSELSENK